MWWPYWICRGSCDDLPPGSSRPHPREWHHSFATPSLMKNGLRNSSLSLWPGWWPLKLMESMLSLLGMDDDGFIFTYVFLQQLLAPAQAGLANSLSLAEQDYRSLTEEMDHILLVIRSFGIQTIVPTGSPVTPTIFPGAIRRIDGGWDHCDFTISVLALQHGRLAVLRPREMRLPALCSSRDRWHKERLLFIEDSLKKTFSSWL